MKNYPEALSWLEHSDYEVLPTLQSDKKTIRIDLIHNKKVIKSDYTTLSTNFPQYIQEKILTLYNHFNP